jgi:hypothetical protein
MEVVVGKVMKKSDECVVDGFEAVVVREECGPVRGPTGSE